MTKRILIADDEPTILALAKVKLESQGYVVETARNGKDALNIMKSSHLDLIVLDVVMPVMDGVDVYKEMKKSPQLASVPVVIITDSKIFRDSFQTLGVEHFLPKPLDSDKLLHKVEYIFTCDELSRKNKHVLVLGGNSEVNHNITRILQEHQLIVGKGADPIEFVSNTLILVPQVVLIEALLKGDVPSPQIIRAIKSFSRLRDTKVLVYTWFAPDDIGSINGVEQLNGIKDECMAAGATKYIGRFTPATFWDLVREYFD
jgi:CheY-like chemotaxis protein